MLSKLLVHFYFFFHGTLGLPGAGWLIRRLRPLVPGLWNYPLSLPEIGTAVLDFRDDAAFGFLNFCLGDCGHSKELLRFMERVLHPGAVLWDVGANIGLVSLYFAKPQYGLREIHAFEPNPDALKTLQSLVTCHPTIRVHPVGLGVKDETLEMRASCKGSTDSSLVRELNHRTKIVSIPIRCGDTYLDEKALSHPDVIKIDVEGFEPQVIAGLGQLIQRKRPTIFFEHIWLTEEQIADLVPERYELQYILGDGTMTCKASRRWEGIDAVLTPTERDSLAL